MKFLHILDVWNHLETFKFSMLKAAQKKLKTVFDGLLTAQFVAYVRASDPYVISGNYQPILMGQTADDSPRCKPPFDSQNKIIWWGRGRPDSFVEFACDVLYLPNVYEPISKETPFDA